MMNLIFLTALMSANAEPVVLDVPIVAVSGTHGVVVQTELSLTRSSKNHSVRISVVEDTPSGSGEMMRAALWQAVTAVGMERANPLSSHRFDWTLPGRVDGPSAGAMIAVAIETALDGRELPSGTVMTGTIRPDGTIGMVGGVHLKMEGARKAGFTRFFYPAHLRTEQDRHGSLIFLDEHCERLGLQCFPVSTVEEAYAKIHHLPHKVLAPKRVVNSPISSSTMSATLKDSHDSLETLSKAFQGFSRSNSSQPDPAMAAMSIQALGALSNSEVAMHQGNLAYAYESAMDGWTLLTGLGWAYQPDLTRTEVAELYGTLQASSAEGLFAHCISTELHDTPMERLGLSIAKARAFREEHDPPQHIIRNLIRSSPSNKAHAIELEHLLYNYLTASKRSLSSEGHTVSSWDQIQLNCWPTIGGELHNKAKSKTPSDLANSIEWHLMAVSHVASVLQRKEWGGAQSSDSNWTYKNPILVQSSLRQARQRAAQQWSVCEPGICEQTATDLLYNDGVHAQSDSDPANVYERYLLLELTLKARWFIISDGETQ